MYLLGGVDKNNNWKTNPSDWSSNLLYRDLSWTPDADTIIVLIPSRLAFPTLLSDSPRPLVASHHSFFSIKRQHPLSHPRCLLLLSQGKRKQREGNVLRLAHPLPSCQHLFPRFYAPPPNMLLSQSRPSWCTSSHPFCPTPELCPVVLLSLLRQFLTLYWIILIGTQMRHYVAHH